MLEPPSALLDERGAIYHEKSGGIVIAASSRRG